MAGAYDGIHPLPWRIWRDSRFTLDAKQSPCYVLWEDISESPTTPVAGEMAVLVSLVKVERNTLSKGIHKEPEYQLVTLLIPPLTGTQHVGGWALLFQGSDPHLGSRAMNLSLRSLLGE